MGSLELLSYFWSLNTILVVKIANFDFDGLSPPPTPVYFLGTFHFALFNFYLASLLPLSGLKKLPNSRLWIIFPFCLLWKFSSYMDNVVWVGGWQHVVALSQSRMRKCSMQHKFPNFFFAQNVTQSKIPEDTCPPVALRAERGLH